ncbi:uncharacterized protein Dana_GF26964 [Drosophila ananassae]|uniref:Uncharacterized protein n=1 Tax=Drosophila ananassae TaxID=7217 RepID=A0A0P8YGG9_DROAN|nr:uncharacterized protein Dana_GF26964 [Drosophila ananassae]
MKYLFVLFVGISVILPLIFAQDEHCKLVIKDLMKKCGADIRSAACKSIFETAKHAPCYDEMVKKAK